jgi:hypothetical protein
MSLHIKQKGYGVRDKESAVGFETKGFIVVMMNVLVHLRFFGFYFGEAEGHESGRSNSSNTPNSAPTYTSFCPNQWQTNDTCCSLGRTGHTPWTMYQVVVHLI